MTRLPLAFTMLLGLVAATNSGNASDFIILKPPPVELKDGDRVVLLGGTFIERAQLYGHFEYAMQVAYPDRSFTVRNLGWAGDTVWSEARGIFDTPQKGRERMLKQIRDLKPTTIWVCYGQGEALSRVEPEQFRTGLNSLLDELQPTTERIAIIIPPLFPQAPKPFPASDANNAHLSKLVQVLNSLAATRQLSTVDLHGITYPEGEPLTENGVHLNDRGYELVAAELIKHLSGAATAPVAKNRLQRLPLPTEHEEIRRSSLTDSDIITNAETLREAIVHKNWLYFQRWRPQNVTYLYLFRKHEQGQNAKEVKQFDPLVQEQDERIGKLKRVSQGM